MLKSKTIETPLGSMVAISNQKKLLLLEFADKLSLSNFDSPVTPGETPPLRSIKKELDAYFANKSTTFKTPIELNGTPFQKQVWRELMKIPPGETRSYYDIAKAVGKPTGFRAVANANGCNQLVIIVPCHRVTQKSGDLGGYNGGVERKAWLLNHEKKRCFGGGSEVYSHYHDHEWGVPNHDDRHLFEMLILEGAQAGLSWETILKRREGYRKAFFNFDPKKVAKMTDKQLDKLCENPEIIRNRRKIYSARENAKVYLEIQKEYGSFDRYLWIFVDNEPIINHFRSFKEVPAKTELSDAISKDLKKRGMSFVGSTIIYAYMQAVGLVWDHTQECYLSNET